MSETEQARVGPGLGYLKFVAPQCLQTQPQAKTEARVTVTVVRDFASATNLKARPGGASGRTRAGSQCHWHHQCRWIAAATGAGAARFNFRVAGTSR